MTLGSPVLNDVTARRVRVFVPVPSPRRRDRISFFVFSGESSTEYSIRESASIAVPAQEARSEARQRLVMLRERAARRVRLLPFYEETAGEIAERSIDHQALFEMQTRTKAWASED